MTFQDLDAVKINFDEQGVFIINIALAVIMFGVALDISVSDFLKLLRKPKLLAVGVISQFIMLPLLTFIFVSIIQPHPSIALGMFMVAACPGGNISNFMSHLAGGNTALSIGLTAFGTFMAMIFTPLNFHIYGSIYEPTSNILRQVSVDPMELVKVVSLILGIPLILGMYCRSKNQKLSHKVARLLKPVSITIFVAIVIGALLNNSEIFSEYITEVLGLGVSHNVLAIVAGFLLAKLFRLGFKEQKTIAIETGIQNSGLGLLLIFTFFTELGGMALIAAFWGIWHIVSGLMLSSYWSRFHKIRNEV